MRVSFFLGIWVLILLNCVSNDARAQKHTISIVSVIGKCDILTSGSKTTLYNLNPGVSYSLNRLLKNKSYNVGTEILLKNKKVIIPFRYFSNFKFNYPIRTIDEPELELNIFRQAKIYSYKTLFVNLDFGLGACLKLNDLFISDRSISGFSNYENTIYRYYLEEYHNHAISPNLLTRLSIGHSFSKFKMSLGIYFAYAPLMPLNFHVATLDVKKLQTPFYYYVVYNSNTIQGNLNFLF